MSRRLDGPLDVVVPRGDSHAGLRWNDANKIELDPDPRVREAIRLVFRKFTELGSARQVLKWFRSECVTLPVAPLDQSGLIWKLPDTQAIHGYLTNPFYAGAFAEPPPPGLAERMRSGIPVPPDPVVVPFEDAAPPGKSRCASTLPPRYLHPKMSIASSSG
jgi:hypothetical protein